MRRAALTMEKYLVAKKKLQIKDERAGDLFRLNYMILKSGECVIGTQGGSFGAFRSAGGAAWWLRQFADAIEKDADSAGEKP